MFVCQTAVVGRQYVSRSNSCGRKAGMLVGSNSCGRKAGMLVGSNSCGR